MSNDSDSSEPLMHNSRNISFDALKANRELHNAGESVTSRESSIPVDLVWRNLVFDVPMPKPKKGDPEPAAQAPVEPGTEPLRPGMKRILHGISGQVRQGQVLAIMGASGSGKTTMLNLLSGRMKSSKKCTTGGQILINGQSRDYTTFRQVAKFVEQDDTTMFAELTVREQILYSARLALPGTISEAQKVARVNKIIQELGLSKCKDTYIGSELVRGVSGGERRRAAIGVELVSDPSLLFLDEPTTGLDSFNALNVMLSLRRLAANGRTIVTTIHQPRSSIFHLFDMLCLIAEGRTVYFGPANDAADYFSNLGFTNPSSFNVADFAIDILSIDTRTPEQEEKTNTRIEYFSDHYKQNVQPRFIQEADVHSNANPQQPLEGQLQESNGIFKEFSILARRTFTLMSREKQLNITRLSQTLLFGVLLGLIWLNTGRDNDALAEDPTRIAIQGVLFFVVINQCFDAAFGIIFTYATERAIVDRERSSGYYRDISYFLGKQLCELPRAIFFNILMLSIIYFMVGLRANAGAFFTLLLINFLGAIAGEGLSQTVSVFAGDEQTAAALVPVFVILQVLFAGFFIRPNALPGYIQWARYLSFLYYAFNAALRNEFIGNEDGLETIRETMQIDLAVWPSIAVVAAFAVALKLTFFTAFSLKRPRFDNNL